MKRWSSDRVHQVRTVSHRELFPRTRSHAPATPPQDVLLARLQQQLAELKALRGSHGAGGPGAGAGASIGSGGALAGGTPVAASARGRAAGEAASLLPFPPRGGHGEERGGGVGGSGGFAAHPIALTPDASTRTTPVPGEEQQQGACKRSCSGAARGRASLMWRCTAAVAQAFDSLHP